MRGCHGAYSPRFIHQTGLLAGSAPGGHVRLHRAAQRVGTDSAAPTSSTSGFAVSGRVRAQDPRELRQRRSGCRIPTRRTGYVVPEIARRAAASERPARPTPDRICGLGHARRLHGPVAPRRVGQRALLPQRQRADRVGRAQALGSPDRLAAPADPASEATRWAIAATTPLSPRLRLRQARLEVRDAEVRSEHRRGLQHDAARRAMT